MEGKAEVEVQVTPKSLITVESVKKALLEDKGNGAKLLSWKAVDFTKMGDHYASFVTSVKVKYSQKEQIEDVTYVVKINPCRNSSHFEILTTAFFLKEANFYLRLIPELNSVLETKSLELLHFPLCLHAELEEHKQLIYFQDVRRQGFRMFDKRKGMDPLHASLVLKELGRLHAASVILEDRTKEPLEIKHNYLKKDFTNMREDEDEATFNDNMGHIISSTVQVLEKVGGYEKAIPWLESLKPRLRYLMSDGLLGSSKFNVVNHGDCWNNNLLFRYNNDDQPIDVMLLDLQICRKASVATDLNYLFMTSMTGEVRKANTKSFLSTYYASFKSVLETGGLEIQFTEDDLLEEYRSKNTLGVVFGMMVLPYILQDTSIFDEEDNKTDVGMEELKIKFRHRAEAMTNKSVLTKERFLAIFDEFMESGLIQ